MMVNGVPVNEMEWGGIYWSNWAGLSDVTRFIQVQRGLGASKIAVPSVGGSINIVTNTTNAEAGGSVSYGVGNDGYNKVAFSLSTGLLKNGWAMSILGARTWGDGYIQGTDFVGYSYFINVSKRLGENHELSLTALGAPQCIINVIGMIRCLSRLGRSWTIRSIIHLTVLQIGKERRCGKFRHIINITSLKFH